MQSRFQPLLSFAGTVLLAVLPLAGLAAQSTTMSKDEGSMAKSTAMSGMLHGAGGHRATGTVHLVAKGDKHQIHFTPDFKADAGSDVYVVLSKSEAPEAGSVQLGRLKHVAGEQTVEVPAKVDVSQYSHLLLWSKKDNVVIGMTDLADAGMSMDHDKMSGGMEHPTMGKDKMGHDSQPPQH
jgi:hypothetical protein